MNDHCSRLRGLISHRHARFLQSIPSGIAFAVFAALAVSLSVVTQASAAQTAEAQSVTSSATETGYQRLAEASVAAAIGLSTEQQTQVTSLLAERDAALSTADEATRTTISADTNRKLAAVLSEEQQRLFASLFQGKMLKFNFRYQKWSDVLDWVSKEADLSLVMDTPPPGTFHYADSREYTTAEAIDLLNGWLLTKGFTLVRRERMLMCLDLKSGLPEGSIPRVSLSELPTRGRFDVVSVLIPLEGRPAEAALAEIRPLLGKYGKAEALAQTQQLMVTDTAMNLRMMEQTVQKVPLPSTPPAPPAAPPKPELIVYPIQHANPLQAGEVLKQIVSGAVVVDEKARQISINATPDDQAKAKAIISQLESNQGPDNQPGLQLYSVQTTDNDQLLTTLKLVAPAAQIRLDPELEKLVVWASTEDHQNIAKSLKQLETAPTTTSVRQLQVYPLNVVDPATASSLLQSLLPSVKMNVDTRSRSLIAVGTLADHEAIRTLIDQLESEAGGELPELQFYPLEKSRGSSAVTILSAIAPSAQISFQEDARRLSVVATKADHDAIAATIQKLEASAPEAERRTIILYDVTASQRTRFQAIAAGLISELPGMQLIADAQPDELAVWATPTQHAAVAEILTQLKRDLPTEQQPQLIVYPIRQVDPSGVAEVLTSLFPDAKITTDVKSSRLMIHARPAVQKTIRAAIEQLDTDVPVEKEIKLMVYPVNGLNATTAQNLIAAELPEVTVISDPTAETLIVRGRLQDQQVVAELLDSLRAAAAPLQERRAVAYPAMFSDPIRTNEFFASAFPKARVVMDVNSRRMTVWATDAEHQKVGEAVAEMSRADGSRSLQIFDTGRVSRTTAMQILTASMPEVTFLQTPAEHSLMAWLDESQAGMAQQILKQLMESAALSGERSLRFYDVAAQNSTQTRDLLAVTYPDVSLTITADQQKLMAWVTADQDAHIQQLLLQLAEEKPFEVTRSLQFYSIRDLGPSTTAVLTQTVPNARINPGANADQLAIVASAAEHEQITALLKQLNDRKQLPAERTLSVHDIAGIDPTAVQQVLRPLLDNDVQVTFDNTGRRLFIRANTEKQQRIRTIIEQITSTLTTDAGRTIKTYLVGAPNADEAQEVLLALFPDAKIVTDSDRKLLVATATAEQHQMIEEITSQMRGAALDGDRPTAAVYELKNASATEVQTLLQSLYSRFDGVRLSVSETTGRLVAVARPEQHQAIQDLVRQLDDTSAIQSPHELAVFRLNRIDGRAIQEALQPVLPKSALVSADRIGGQLFVSAAADDMPRIRELVQQALSSAGQSVGLQTRSYRLMPYEAGKARQVLQALYPDATLVTDGSDEVLVATATPEQHQTIQTVVSEMVNRGGEAGTGPSVRAYPLTVADGLSAVSALQGMFGRRDDVRISFDAKSRTLVAVARPSQHELIQTLVEQLERTDPTTGPRTLEIYPLRNIDGVSAVQMAEGVLLSIDPAATISYERQSRQLIVTTFESGHQKIRAAVDRFTQREPREVDVIQLRFLSATSAQMSIEGLFNDKTADSEELPLIQADDDSQQLLIRALPSQIKEIRTLLAKMGESGLTEPGVNVAKGNMRVIPVNGDVETTLQRIQDLWPRVRRNPLRVLRPGQNIHSSPPMQQPGQQQLPPVNNQFSIPAESLDEQPSTPASLIDEQQEPPAVTIISGEDRVTLVSDDLEALDQLEAILKAAFSQSAPGGSRNRDFAVYQLRNAGADDVARTLRSVYESRAGLLAFGSVVLVPEPRMNALIVYGGRTDRERIEQLLEILDTEKLPDSARAFRTQVISVRYTNAAQIDAVLRGVYRAEMVAGGSRQNIEIPTGVPAAVASVLRQINAAASSPLLTIEVQQDTNSLVIKAPQELLQEVSQLVNELDEAASANRSSGITLLPLKKTNSTRVMRILGDVLNSRQRSGSR